MREGQKIREILKDLPSDTRLFRINAGVGWQGETVRREGNILILKNPRPLRAAPKGWSDLVGWRAVEITNEMVGMTIAQVVAKEIKMSGKVDPAQQAFGDLVVSMGGIFEVVRQ